MSQLVQVPYSVVEMSRSVLVGGKLPVCLQEQVMALNSRVSLTVSRGPKTPSLRLIQAWGLGWGGRKYGVWVICLGRHSSFDPSSV